MRGAVEDMSSSLDRLAEYADYLEGKVTVNPYTDSRRAQYRPDGTKVVGVRQHLIEDIRGAMDDKRRADELLSAICRRHGIMLVTTG